MSGEIRMRLMLPVTRIGYGIFSFDPVEQMIGAPLTEILSSLMTGPVFRQPSVAGPAVEVYPLALPDGEGATIPLGAFGELGFRAERGLLVLTVPMQGAAWAQQALGAAIVKGPVSGLSLDGQSRVVSFWVRLRAGMRARFPLGALGELGVEAG